MGNRVQFSRMHLKSSCKWLHLIIYACLCRRAIVQKINVLNGLFTGDLSLLIDQSRWKHFRPTDQRRLECKLPFSVSFPWSEYEVPGHLLSSQCWKVKYLKEECFVTGVLVRVSLFSSNIFHQVYHHQQTYRVSAVSSWTWHRPSATDATPGHNLCPINSLSWKRQRIHARSTCRLYSNTQLANFKNRKTIASGGKRQIRWVFSFENYLVAMSKHRTFKSMLDILDVNY